MKTENQDRKQGNRPHFIRDWADHCDLRQVDIAVKLDADKGLVSRWFDGATPSRAYQIKLSRLFYNATDDAAPDPHLIFQHPDDFWLRGFMAKRSPEEVRRIKSVLLAMFDDE